LEKCGEAARLRGHRERALSCYQRALRIYLHLKKPREAERVSEKIKTILD